MAFNVSDFSATLNKRGVAKQAHFEMIVSFPPSMPLNALFNGATNELGFRCDSAEIPGRSIQTSQYKPYGTGLTHKVGYDVTYPEVTVSMICGSDLLERDIFSAWQSMIIGQHAIRPNAYQQNMHVGYYNKYARGTVTILQYDEQGKVSNSYSLRDAYPVIINSMPVTWSSEEVHRVTIQFSYLHYVENVIMPGGGFSVKPFLNDLGRQAKNQISNYVKDLAIGAVAREANKVIGNIGKLF